MDSTHSEFITELISSSGHTNTNCYIPTPPPALRITISFIILLFALQYIAAKMDSFNIMTGISLNLQIANIIVYNSTNYYIPVLYLASFLVALQYIVVKSFSPIVNTETGLIWQFSKIAIVHNITIFYTEIFIEETFYIEIVLFKLTKASFKRQIYWLNDWKLSMLNKYFIHLKTKKLFYHFMQKQVLAEDFYFLLIAWIKCTFCTYLICLHSAISSWMSRRRAEEEAERWIREGRRTRARDGDTFLVPAPETIEWCGKGLFNKENLVSIVTKAKPVTHRKVGRDREGMDRFLDAVWRHSSDVPVMTGPGSGSFNPVSVPLLDYLKVDSDRADSWSYPTRNPEQEEVVVSTKRIPEVYLGVQNAWYQCPCRLMYGNGTSWSLQIRIPVEERLETMDWRAPETENQSGLALHRDFSSTFVSLDPEQPLQRDGVTLLHRLVKQKPVRERLQERIRLHPRSWRQLICLMEQRPEYNPVFQHVYEHLRLTYIRTTGDLDTTLSSIEDDISRGNVVLETQLEDAVEAAELRMRRWLLHVQTGRVRPLGRGGQRSLRQVGVHLHHSDCGARDWVHRCPG